MFGPDPAPVINPPRSCLTLGREMVSCRAINYVYITNRYNIVPVSLVLQTTGEIEYRSLHIFPPLRLAWLELDIPTMLLVDWVRIVQHLSLWEARTLK